MSATIVYRILAALFVAAIGVQRYATVRRSGDVERYMHRIEAAGAVVPDRIGAWIGQDVKVPAQALTVLKPNVMLSRRYVNVEDGTAAGVVLVHCADAHHMVGHFPLRCYPAQGWKVVSTQTRDWTAGGLRITGTEYEFNQSSLEKGDESLVVINCLLRPGGEIVRNMDELSATLTGANGSSSGAGQLQVYFSTAVPKEKRDQAFQSLVEGYRPVLRAIPGRPAERIEINAIDGSVAANPIAPHSYLC